MTVHLPGVPDTEIIDVLTFSEGNPLGLPPTIPVVKVNWMDERQTCQLVLRYLAGEIEGSQDQYMGCQSYMEFGCARCGQADPQRCVFEEPEYAEIWHKAMAWRLLEEPDGTVSVCLARSAGEIAADLGARIVGAVPVEVKR